MASAAQQLGCPLASCGDSLRHGKCAHTYRFCWWITLSFRHCCPDLCLSGKRTAVPSKKGAWLKRLVSLTALDFTKETLCSFLDILVFITPSFWSSTSIGWAWEASVFSSKAHSLKVRKRKTNIWHHLYVESRKMVQIYWQNRNRNKDVENKRVATKPHGGKVQYELGDWDWHIYNTYIHTHKYCVC